MKNKTPFNLLLSLIGAHNLECGPDKASLIVTREYGTTQTTVTHEPHGSGKSEATKTIEAQTANRTIITLSGPKEISRINIWDSNATDADNDNRKDEMAISILEELFTKAIVSVGEPSIEDAFVDIFDAADQCGGVHGDDGNHSIKSDELVNLWDAVNSYRHIAESVAKRRTK